jgi:Fur family transcriptional regulator, peroxide stress response regulator
LKEVRKEISKAGLKATPQRLAILKYIRKNMTHPTAEKVYQDLSRAYPGLSLKTVYKTLETFAEAGMIRGLDIDPKKMRFDACLDEHDHFYCEVCENIFDIAATPSGENWRNRKDMQGHNVQKISINFKGVCKFCENGESR